MFNKVIDIGIIVAIGIICWLASELILRACKVPPEK